MCIQHNKDALDLSANPLLQRQDPRTVLTVSSPRSVHVTPESVTGTSGCPCHAISLLNCRQIVGSTEGFCYLHKTHKTHCYVFLLIFLFGVIVQTSSAFPATSSEGSPGLHTTQYRLRHLQQLHHLQHRSVSTTMDEEMNGGSHEVDYNKISYDFCSNADHLKNMLVQADKTYAYISSILGDYTNSQYKKTPEDVHITWMKHMFQLEHPLAKALERDFYKLPDKQHFAKFLTEPLTRKMIYKEMQNVYSTLKVLKNALDVVIKHRKDNKIQLLHDLHNNVASFNKINDFFAELNKMVKVDMHEVVKFMEKLAIPLPEVNDQIAFHSRTEIRDWLLASEQLSVTQYLRVLYRTLLEKCPDINGDD